MFRMVSKMEESCEEGLRGWDFLREHLKVLVSMQRLWGQIGDLYKGSNESLYTQEVLPPFVRGPDSKLTRYWDLCQVSAPPDPPASSPRARNGRAL